jgi:hypothetical protein
MIGCPEAAHNFARAAYQASAFIVPLAREASAGFFVIAMPAHYNYTFRL